MKSFGADMAVTLPEEASKAEDRRREKKFPKSVSWLRQSPVPSRDMVGDDHAEEFGELEQTLSAHEVKRLDQLNNGWIEWLALFS